MEDLYSDKIIIERDNHVLSLQTIDYLDLSGKTVLVRADLNLPVQDGQVTDDTRVRRLLPTIQELIEKGAKIILMSHFGRPKGGYREEDSLKQLLSTLAKIFGQMPLFAPDCIGEAAQRLAKTLQPGQTLLLENLRFHEGEEKNDPVFAQELAKLGDVYVNDAFSCSHRSHASVVAITQFLPSVAGLGMLAELEALNRIMGMPQRPVMAIVAGSKISTKLTLLTNLVKKVDLLVVGGGMANTFLAALHHPIGQSLCENDMLEAACAILKAAKNFGCTIILPQDVVVTKDIKSPSVRHVVALSDIQADDKIVDLGDKTVADICDRLTRCGTVVWNGPVGIFEIPPFDVATTAIAKAIAAQTAAGKLVSVAGGGDTLAALAHAGCSAELTYTSTAGGAFLEWLEGKILPGLEALETAQATNIF